MRRGFTLIEMLVATAVFALGFTSCFALFLAGVRYRTQAEDLTRLSLAAGSLVNEIAIDSGKHGPGGKPDDYVGNGRADDGAEGGLDLYPYPGTGTWFRVLDCTDLVGGQDPASPTLHLTVLVLSFQTGGTTLSLKEVADRVGTRQRTVTTPAEALAVADELAARQVAVVLRTAILRHPTWF